MYSKNAYKTKNMHLFYDSDCQLLIDTSHKYASITRNLAFAPIDDSDQAAHMRSLIRVFDGRTIGRQGLNISSGGKL